MSREHQKALDRRLEIIQGEVQGVRGETQTFFKYSLVVAAVTTAGLLGVGTFVPAVARLSPAKKFFVVSMITPIPGYVWAEHEITRKAIERAKLRRTHNIRDAEVDRAKEYYNQKPFFYRYRTEMTAGFAALGLGSGVVAAYGSRHLTTQQKWVKTRMWFSTAGVGTAVGLGLIWAATSQEQKDDMQDTKYQRYKKSSGM